MPNIEIEKKFIPRQQDIDAIAERFEFRGEKKFVDRYYDTPSYDLTSKDIWLRSRGQKYELKIPILDQEQNKTDQYRELEDDGDISNFLQLPAEGKLEEQLTKNGYSPFCAIETTRKTFTDNKFTIVLDLTDFGYNIAEVELLINDEKQASLATQEIYDFAQNLGLPLSPVRGKVIEYLRLTKEDHFKALVASGTIRPDQLT